MELHEREVAQAKEKVAASGRDPEDFSFEIAFQPPDPDGGGMFTLRYDITIKRAVNGKSLGLVGGIGLHWVLDFEDELNAGYFD